MNMLQDNKSSEQKPEKKVLVGKAWVKEDGSFSVAKLTVPVEGKEGKYRTSDVYPFIVTDYCRITFGPNKKRDAGKNQNTHWVFLNVEEDRIEEYEKMCAKIGQNLSEDK